MPLPCFVSQWDLKRDTFWTGRTTCGLKCSPRRNRDGYIVTLVKQFVTIRCCMKQAGVKNLLMSLLFLKIRYVFGSIVGYVPFRLC